MYKVLLTHPRLPREEVILNSLDDFNDRLWWMEIINEEFKRLGYSKAKDFFLDGGNNLFVGSEDWVFDEQYCDILIGKIIEV